MTVKRLCVILLAAALSAGCRKDNSNADAPSPRVVTFSPAITQIVFDMGLGDHVVGVTKHCRLPAGQERTIVGDALNVRAEPILAVKPDIVLSQTESKRFAALKRLNPDIRIENIRIETLEDVSNAMERIGRLLGRPDVARAAGESFRRRLAATRRRVVMANVRPRKVLFVSGYRQPLAAGRNTFIDEMIELAGGVNVAAKSVNGWRGVSLEGIIRMAPEVIVCRVNNSEAPEAKAYFTALKNTPAGRDGRVFVVTDEQWTFPTGRLADLAERLAEMVHPELKKKGPKP